MKTNILQSLSQKFEINKLLKICFQSSIIISGLLVTACSSTNKQAQFEPCSYADSMKSEAAFQNAFGSCVENAREGDAVSQKNLAYMYYFGSKHVTKNVDEGKKWFQFAAARGNQSAQYRLDLMVQGTMLSSLSK